MPQDELLELTAEIVCSHVANNSVAAGDVPTLVKRVYGAFSSRGDGGSARQEEQEMSPVVSIRASVKPDYIVCMEYGRKQKTLKRHLQTAHGMTPEQYRKDYGLRLPNGRRQLLGNQALDGPSDWIGTQAASG